MGDLPRHRTASYGCCCWLDEHARQLRSAISGWTIGTILEMAISRRAAADQVDVSVISKTAKQAALAQGYDITLVAFVVLSFVAVIAWLPINAERSLDE